MKNAILEELEKLNKESANLEYEATQLMGLDLKDGKYVEVFKAPLTDEQKQINLGRVKQIMIERNVGFLEASNEVGRSLGYE